MSTISGISSISAARNLYQAEAAPNSVSRAAASFQAVGGALKAGDLATAQAALVAFQHQLPAVASANTQPFGQNAQANSDYQNLTRSLKLGDLSGAQKSFSSLQAHLQAGERTQGQSAGASVSQAGAPADQSGNSSFGSILNGILKSAG